MAKWTSEELEKFTTADDFHISPFYDDGVTYGTPTWIWSVVVDQDLYVRAYNGQNSRWYQSAMTQKAGRISLAGATYEVSFEPAADDAALNHAVSDAYTAKYGDSAYLPPMLETGPISATVRVIKK